MGEQYEAEQRRTIEIGPWLALFVEKNAILGFNASLGAYLRAQIESLQNRIPPDPQSPTSTFFRASSISEDRWTATTRSGGSSSRPSQTAMQRCRRLARRVADQAAEGARPRQGPTPWLQGKRTSAACFLAMPSLSVEKGTQAEHTRDSSN